MQISELDKTMHEVRKPLNSISMQAELIKMLAVDNPELIAAAEKILTNVQICSQQLQRLHVDIVAE